MWLEILCGVVACEALVQLWFDAAPLLHVREWTIDHTPFLYSKMQEKHLLRCKYCMSVWVAFCLTLLYFTYESMYMLIVIFLSVHRLSNFLHLVFSLCRDRQIDLRVARRQQLKKG
jgi:hypothetical protein